MAIDPTLTGVVVIAAGRGGRASLEKVLAGLPEDFPVPVVVAYARGAGVEPELRAALHAKLPLPVREVNDKDDLVGGAVLLGPADYHLLVELGSLALSVEAPSQDARPAADALFESASDAFKARVTAVLLGGEGADGARGLLAVKRRGGFAIIEDPATTPARSMPAAAADIADRVLAAPQIAASLLERLVPSRPAAVVEEGR